MLSRRLDPIVEAEKLRQEELKELKQRKDKQRHTVKSIFQDWKQAELQNRKDRGEEVERAFEKDVFPLIGNLVIGEVTRSDIKEVLDRPLKRKVNRMANRLLSDLKQFFGYADDEELIVLDPTRKLIKERVGGKEKSRQRFLSNKEIQMLFELLPVSGIKKEYQLLIWLLLATGCRVNEVLRAKWDHIDLKKRVLHIPSEHSKNTFKHDIYLSDFALTHLTELKKTSKSDWLVPNRTGNGAITRQVLTKQITDRQQKSDLKGRVLNNQTLVLPSGRWVIHDLRRTVGTIMQEVGVMPHIIKKCLKKK